MVPDYILKELKAFNKGLQLSWAEYPINHRTGAILIRYAKRPAFHVWLEKEGRMHYLFEVTDPDGKPSREVNLRNTVQRIRGDMFSQGYTPEAVEQMIRKQEALREERQAKALDGAVADTLKANARFLADAKEAAIRGEADTKFHRDAKTFHYEGRANNASPAEKERIKRTNEEVGFEKCPLPEVSKIK